MLLLNWKLKNPKCKNQRNAKHLTINTWISERDRRVQKSFIRTKIHVTIGKKRAQNIAYRDRIGKAHYASKFTKK